MRLAALVLSLGVLGLACADDDTTGPENSLEGAWDLVGFTDEGISAATTGAVEFRPDGTFEGQGTVAFPEEPAEPLVIQGTYQMTGSDVRLTTSDGSLTWSLQFSASQVVLTLQAPPPSSTITLRRRSD